MLCLIAAMSENRVIGRDNRLPWRLPADLRHFKALTMGHPIIMGRRTWESLGKPLPGRRNIVLTRDRSFTADGAVAVADLDEALDAAKGEDLFVIGGEQVYRLALPRVDRVYLTVVHTTLEGDALFPELGLEAWRETEREHHTADAENPYDYTFVRYDRR